MIIIHSIIMLTRAGNGGPMGCHTVENKHHPANITFIHKYHTQISYKANIIQFIFNIYHHQARPPPRWSIRSYLIPFN